MSNDIKLGTTPTGTEGRDAVHIAIVSVRAMHPLEPGQRVAVDRDGYAAVAESDEFACGIVDPFSGRAIIEPHEWFWLCLYPKSITSLRHVWEHPSFPASITEVPALVEVSEGAKAMGEARAWLADYVKRHCPYDDLEGDWGLQKFLKNVTEDKTIFYHGSDCHSLEDVENRDELFRHLSIVLGKRIDAAYFKYFSCSC